MLEVRDGRLLGLWWEPWERGTRARTRPPRGVVWHWTGGVGGHQQIHRTLRNRKDKKTGRPTPLSIHYTIDSSGTVVEQADPSTTVCLHAGTANEWSVGIEIAHKGFAPADPRFPRSRYDVEIHGKTKRVLRFADEQIKAALELADYLSDLFGIPRRVPLRDDGTLILDTLSGPKLATYRGHLGHLHVSDEKSDPGSDLLLAFRDAWGKR